MEEISIGHLAKLFLKVSGSERNVNFAASNDKEYLTDNPQRRCPDISKIKHTLEWEPHIDLKTGIKKTVEWNRKFNKEVAK